MPSPIHLLDPSKTTPPRTKEDDQVQTTSTSRRFSDSSVPSKTMPRHRVSKKILLPTVFATRIPLCPLDPLTIATNFSGSVVASDNTVAPNTDSDSPKADARVVEL